jgi:hypothetical protein
MIGLGARGMLVEESTKRAVGKFGMRVEGRGSE